MEDTNSRKSPVTYRFKNIGPVKDAQMELGDLTIIAGRNNTGKTYIAYTLYGFLRTLGQMWMDLHSVGFFANPEKFLDIRSITEKVVLEGMARVPLDDKIIERHRKLLIQKLANSFSERALPTVFSAQPGDFDDSFLGVQCTEVARKDRRTFKAHFQKDINFAIKYEENNFVLVISYPKDVNISDLGYEILSNYFNFLLRGLFPDPFILSAERFGISLFYRELDFTKNQLVDLLQKMADENSRDRVSPFLFIDRTTSRYALPIKDNIDYTRSIPDLRGKKSTIYDDKLFDDIKSMMEGYYGNSGDDIRFISKARGKGRSFNIPLHLASSSARGLSDFFFFLRHVASSNHLLIIDEPESHLDTANQIQLARLLARFVRAGSKVLITTHSDYLIKEVNNLVMLSQPIPDKDSVIKKYRYGKNDFLEAESIRAYIAEKNGLTRCEVDQFGIDMPVFDETIDEINKVANELSSRLSEDSEE